MFKNFHLSQQAVIFNSEGKLLILKTQDNLWLLPGGRMEDGETDFAQALARELKEETGYKLVNVGEIITFDTTPKMSTIALAFICEVENLENVSLSNEHKEYKWIEKWEAPQYLYYNKIGEAIAKL